jgi:uncharacterized protein
MAVNAMCSGIDRMSTLRARVRAGLKACATSTARTIVLIVCGLLLTSGVGTAVAQPPPPTLTDTVNDVAHVIDAASKAEIDRRIRALQQTTGDVVVVATVPTIEGYGDIDEYAVKMFENGGRGIGQKGKDNGALIVIAVKERKVRIEVGYDLEAFITDGFAGEVIRNVMAPELRQGRYGPALLAGVTRVINRIAQGRGVTIPNVPQQQPARASRQRPQIPFSVIFLIIIVVIALSRGGGRRRRRGYWGGGPWSGWNSGVGPFGGGGFGGGFGGFGGGGGGGGGFGGFGGGRSGGGGASGGW